MFRKPTRLEELILDQILFTRDRLGDTKVVYHSILNSEDKLIVNFEIRISTSVSFHRRVL